MSRKTVCQKQPLFRERDQDKNPTASSFYIHESEMTGQTLFVLLWNRFCSRDATASVPRDIPMWTWYTWRVESIHQLD